MAELRARLEKFALTLHPDKTRVFEFGRYAAKNRAMRELSKPETFDFLGFTHIAGIDGRGIFQLQRKTRRDRLRVALRTIKESLRQRRHDPIPVQGE